MIVERIFDWARIQPARPALIHNGIVIGYAGLARTLAAAGRFLAGHGLPPGGTAVVVVLNQLDAWILVLALRALGLDTLCARSPAAARALAPVDPVCIVLTAAEAAEHRDAAAAFPGARLVVATAGIYGDLDAPGLPPPPAAGAPAGGHILHTSGTTGTNKKVLVDGPGEDRRNAWRAASLGIAGETVHQGLDLALWTTIGYRYPLAVWHQGGTVVLDQRPDRFRRFFEHGVTSSCLPGPWLQDLLAAGLPPRPAHFTLFFTSGFLSPELADRVTAGLTDSLTVLYGSTELATPALQSRYRRAEDLHWLAPSDKRVVRVTGEGGGECPAGVPGALGIGLDGLDCAAYLDDPEATSAFFRDGFFLPGDMAVRRDDGRIRILGRSVDVINLQGSKLAPGPIEQEIRRRLGVDEVCLFTGLGEAGDEELVVAVESRRPLAAAELAGALGRLAPASRVRTVVLEAFPRTESGARKVDRGRLRKLVYPA